MASRTTLNPVRTQGWRAGFVNLFRKEMGETWGTRSWLVQFVIWAAIINGIMLATFAAPAEPDAQVGDSEGPVAIILLSVMGGMATGVGAVITMQGAVLDEKLNGTAAWLMSKPLSRTAYILAKLAANALSMLIIMIAAQGALAYLILTVAGQAPPLAGFVFGWGLLGLHLMFYTTLTLMLSAIFDSRGGVIAIPLGLLFGWQALASLAPVLADIMPWTLAVPIATGYSLAMDAMLGMPIANWTPVLATIIWCVLFVAISLWRFRHKEF